MKQISFFFLTLFFIFSTAFSIESIDDIQKGGIYSIELKTGNVLEGVVEEKNGEFLIIECQGKPYQFKASLIYAYTLLVAPKTADAKKNIALLTYEELLHRTGASRTISITLRSGTSFVGKMQGIDINNISLNVKGSVIQIARDVIENIIDIEKQQKINAVVKTKTDKQQIKELEKPYDTLYVKNPDGGKPLVIAGKIIIDEENKLVVTLPNFAERTVFRSHVLRIIRNSKTSFEKKIQLYAKPLFCLPNQVLIDIPPITDDQPFFKICIDKYEYPNVRGQIPKTNISYADAQAICKNQGKRLCTTEEWEWSCGGLEKYTYPYGHQLEDQWCNRHGNKQAEGAGTRAKCISKFGVYDMSGNVFEWVTNAAGKPMLMGGPYSKCQTISPGMKGNAKPQVGFRCCKSN